MLLLPRLSLALGSAFAALAVVTRGVVGAESGASTSWSATGPRALVVLGEGDSESSYSLLFGALRSKGYDLTIRRARSSSPQLTKHEENSFDHLLYFASPVAPHSDSDLAPQRIVEFLKRGGNVVFGFDGQIAEANRDFAREFHLDFEERGTGLVDHFRSADKKIDSGNHTAVLVGPSSSSAGVGKGGAVLNPQVFTAETLAKLKSLPVLYRGLAHRVGPLPQAFPLLTAPVTSYSSEAPRAAGKSVQALDDLPDVLTGGKEAALVSAFQLKENSARALFSGSLDLFRDEFVDAANVQALSGSERYSTTANLAFAVDAIGWTLQEHSVLRVASTGHHRVRASATDVRPDYEEDEDSQSVYRVKDIVTFHVDLAQHAPQGGWQPAPSDLDLQVSLVMLDPYVTMSLSAEPARTVLDAGAQTTSNATTRYSASFRLPDRHGVFTFHVDWKRQGWSYVKTKDTAPVRPFNHDEHPRFLSAAYPYVGGAFSTMTAFLLFSTIWLLLKEPVDQKKTQ